MRKILSVYCYASVYHSYDERMQAISRDARMWMELEIPFSLVD